MLITIGIAINEDKINVVPESKSTQLPNSLNIPKKDFAISIIPKTSKRVEGSFIPAPNSKINPDIISTEPRILTSIFFKSNYSLKMCPCDAKNKDEQREPL